MKNVFKAVVLLVAVCCTASSINAQCIIGPDGNAVGPTGQDCINSIVTAVPFLRITPDARSGAIGDAGIAISPDANSIHFNDSKLTFAENDMGISVTYTPWLRDLGVSDVYLAYLSGYKKLDDNQAIGFGLKYFSLGDIQFTDENGQPLGDGMPNEFSLKGSYSRKLSPNFAAGIGLKFIYSNLASGQEVGGTVIEAGTSVAADISLTYNKSIKTDRGTNNLSIGAAITSLGTKMTYTNSINKDFIPTNLGFGFAYDIQLDEHNNFVFTTDINKLLVPSPQVRFRQVESPPGSGTFVEEEIPEYDLDNNGIADYREKSFISGVFGSFGDAPDGFSEELREFSLSFGAEYWYDRQFAVRAGYYWEHATKGNRKYVTLGLGLKYNVFGLNFSYLVPTNNVQSPLDNTLRFSLTFDFGAFGAEEAEDF